MKRDFMLANGWGVVHDETGTHWVYIPLWDPIKFNEVGRAIFTTLVIKQHIGALPEGEAKEILQNVVSEQAKVVSAGFSSAMEEGDGWCGTPYPHHHFGGGGVIPDTDNPVYQKALGKAVTTQIAAKAAITLLGKTLGNESISKAAELIEFNNKYNTKEVEFN